MVLTEDLFPFRGTGGELHWEQAQQDDGVQRRDKAGVVDETGSLKVLQSRGGSLGGFRQPRGIYIQARKGICAATLCWRRDPENLLEQDGAVGALPA